ncbi:MAG: ABC transporter substrate-binding protein [Xanthobacteraceae bacterium]
MQSTQTRRSFLTTLSSAGVVGLVRTRDSYAQEAPPETTTVRLAKIPGICIAPQYVADELLRAEGFTDIRYVATTPGIPAALSLAHGEVDFTANYAPTFIIPIDAGEPITIVGGEHIGCFELFAKEGIRSIPDLKGKNVGVLDIGSSQHIFLSIMAAHVGLDPAKDIHWVTSSSPKPMELFAEGKIDAFLGFPPEPQELRARNIGRVIVNSILDRPWSQYFCCVLAARRNYVRDYPVATKRVIRAIIKAADLCASEPTRVAQHIVDGGFTPRYDYALQTLKELPYARWRDYNTEDTVRFYALRLREAGIIKSSPSKILSDGTDWRHWNELKRELKG